MSIIEFKNVFKSYTSEGNYALQDLSFTIDEGEFICLLGSSGCGKTTTLRIMNKLIPYDSGEIKVLGKNLSEWNSVELRRRTGYVIQNIGLLPHWNVERNILTRYLIDKDPITKDHEVRERQLRNAMNLIGLGKEYLGRYPRELSGGQQQRVGVARALMGNPKLILMDEPFGALDVITRTELQDQLIKIKEETGATFIFVTHDVDEAFKLADRIMIMNEGKIEQFDTPNNLIKHPVSAFVKSFLHSKVNPVELTDYGSEFPCIYYKAWRTEAANLMKLTGTTKLGLTDKNGQFIGMITKRSLAKYLNSDEAMVSLLAAQVRDYAKIDSVDHTVNDLKDLIVKNGYNVPIVITVNGKPTSIISPADQKEIIYGSNV